MDYPADTVPGITHYSRGAGVLTFLALVKAENIIFAVFGCGLAYPISKSKRGYLMIGF
jgi:hypothetical protein